MGRMSKKDGNPTFPDADERVKEAIRKIDIACEQAKARIIREIMEHYRRNRTSPWTGRPLVNLERSMKAIYAEWGKDIKGEFRESLPKLMREFRDDAAAAMRTAGVQSAIIGPPDPKRIQYHLDSSFQQVAMRTDKMRFDHIAHLRRVSAEVFRDASLTGATRQEVSKRLLEKALTVPGFEFIDRAGRKWKHKSYFEMLARTELMNASRASYDETCAEGGYDVMMLSISGNPCPKCEKYEGKLFSLSGATEGIPSKDDLIAAGVFHPNCTHSYSAVPSSRLPPELVKK